MAKTSIKTQQKVSGKKGKGGKVKSGKQAVAIALNEARKSGSEVSPAKRSH